MTNAVVDHMRSDPAGEVLRFGRVGLRGFAGAVLAKETLGAVARALHAANIPVMPLKGALFQLTLYADPAERQLKDVDVLVPEGRFKDAIVALVQHGFQPWTAGRSWIEVGLRPQRGLPVDLHRRLFCAFRYRLETDALFARARVDRQLMEGTPLWIPHPLDTLAHLVGKFVSDHIATGAAPFLLELERWIDHHRLAPELAARHLAASGLARAARHVFARGARERGHPFFEAAARALPPDALGHVLVPLAAELARRGERSALGALSAHLLNSSLPRGMTSLGLAAVYALEHARLTRAAGARGGYWAPFFAGSSSSARRSASSARAL
jgi:hypothetical protein